MKTADGRTSSDRDAGGYPQPLRRDEILSVRKAVDAAFRRRELLKNPRQV